MKNDVKVSVLCTVYNHEKYLERCLISLVNQKTSFKFEILVHDDCSTDNSKQIIEKFHKKYPNLIVPIYEKENQYSQNVKINKDILMPRMKGKYFCFCEGDDYWIDSNKLEKQYCFLENNSEYKFCVHNAIMVDKNDKKIGTITPLFNGGDLTCEDFIKNGGGFVATNSIFACSSLTKQLPKYFDFKTMDYFWQIYLSSCGKTYCFKDYMSAYRVASEGSWTERVLNNREKCLAYKRDLIKSLNLINEEMKWKYNQLFQEQINLINFSIFEMTRDYVKMYSEPYDTIRKNKPLRDRMRYFMYLRFPKLFKLLYRVIKGRRLDE